MGKDREGKVRGKDRRGARAKEGRKGGGLSGNSPQVRIQSPS